MLVNVLALKYVDITTFKSMTDDDTAIIQTY